MSRCLPLALCLAAGFAGCFTIGDSKAPIGTVSVPAPRPAAERTLVIVLPGFGDDAQDMKGHGLAEVIQESWPEADVLLTSATFAYYRDGKLVPRVHEEIVEPALHGAAFHGGYRRIWLAGASMGGMGALLYEREQPGGLTGLVLVAHLLGGEALSVEIRTAERPLI